MAITATIQELLQGILDSQYGRDMRQFIHDAIQKCYEEGSAGETDLVARQAIKNITDTVVNQPNFSQHSWKENWATVDGTYEADYTIPLSGWYMFHMLRLSETVGGAQLMVSPANDHYAFLVVLGAECKSVTLTSQWIYFTRGDQIHVLLTGDSDTRCDLAYAPPTEWLNA